VSDRRSGGLIDPAGAGGWKGRWWGCPVHGALEPAVADLPMGDGVCELDGLPLDLMDALP
jgi:hypothetical protein